MIGSIAYGPVPSRRLGRSLGINNIPPKICSYSCRYCQVGRTADIRIERNAFYAPSELAGQVLEKVSRLKEKREAIDYLAFVPDGEPTLDVNLGKEIDLLRTSGIKIAVITNASLLLREDVRWDLQKADWVCLKADAVTPDIWRMINRPHPDLKLDSVLGGMLDFSKTFKGELVSETMLVKGVNDDVAEVNKIAAFLASLKPAKSYLSVPTRPPAESLEPPSEQSLQEAFHVFAESLSKVEYLIGYEGNDFASTGNAAEDLLSITAVHPMKKEAVKELLNNSGASWEVVHNLIDSGNLVELDYRGEKFYARKQVRRTSDIYKNERRSQNGLQDHR